MTSEAGTLDAVAVTACRLALGLLVNRQYQALEAMTQGQRLSGEQLERAVQEYGRELVASPAQAWSELDAVEVEVARMPTWHVVLPCWTAEDGESDLSLELLLAKTPDAGYDVQVLNLHVL